MKRFLNLGIIMFFVFCLFGIAILASNDIKGFIFFQDLKQFNNNLDQYKLDLLDTVFDLSNPEIESGSIEKGIPNQSNFQQNSYSMKLQNNQITIILQNNNVEQLEIIDNKMKEYCDQEGLDLSLETSEKGRRYVIKGQNLLTKLNEISSIAGMRMNLNIDNNEIVPEKDKNVNNFWEDEDFRSMYDADPFEEFEKKAQEMKEMQKQFLEKFRFYENDNNSLVIPKPQKNNVNEDKAFEKNVKIDNNKIVIDIRTEDDKLMEQIENDLQDYCKDNDCVFTGTKTEFGGRIELNGENIDEKYNEINQFLPENEGLQIEIKQDPIIEKKPDIHEEETKGIRI